MSGGPSRRAMLAGMAAFPALTATACPAPAPATSRDAFEAAVRRYVAARDADLADLKHGALRAAYDLHTQQVAAWRDQYGEPRNAPTDIREEWKRLYGEQCTAEDVHFHTFSQPRFDAATELGKTPAPTLADLIRKVELIEGDSDAEDMLADAMADVRRLAGASC